MNYIKQLNEFWNWAMINSISQGEIILYLAILQCANISNWKSSLNLPNSTLMSFAKISTPSQLNKVRNRLVQTGLITYQKGKGNSCGTYTVVQLYTQSDNQTDKQTDSKRTTNGQSNGRQTDNIYKQNKTKRNEVKDINPLTPFTGKLGEAVDLWLKYKKEKRQEYKPTGLSALIGKIERGVNEIGEDAVIAAINRSMENGWQGLFFDKEKNNTANDDYFARVARGEADI